MIEMKSYRIRKDKIKLIKQNKENHQLWDILIGYMIQTKGGEPYKLRERVKKEDIFHCI